MAVTVIHDPTTDVDASLDVINEETTGAGVTIEGVLIKDSTVDLNGVADALIIDADADTTISAPTDDQIDIEIAGADDFRITANTLTALSGSTIEVDTIAETTSANGVDIDGLKIKDATIQPASGGTAFIDLTQVATGEGDVVLKDNLAAALEVRESTNVYMTFITTDDAERISLAKITRLAVQTIDMADAQVALVYGTAGAGEVKVTGQILLVDANSGATEDLLLPPEATSTGVIFFISNTGGEDIVVKEDGDSTTICTISTTESAFVTCDGTTWRGGIVATT